MSEPNEGNQTETGDVSANTQTSGNAGQPLEANLDLLKRLDAIEKAQAKWQSEKDKSISRAEENIVKRIAEKFGVDASKVEQVERDLLLEDMLAEYQGKRTTSGPGRPQETPVSSEVQTVVTELGLDMSDPQVIAILGEKINPTQAVAKLAKIAIGKATKTTDAQRMALQGNPPKPKGGEEFVSEYKSKVLAARGNKALIQALQVEYASKGVPIGSVVFSV